ncbi:hypothetical protein AAF712_003446 [Marasmius tenuissimus]|uniref:Uncharacterized protein n=1 Tax=Marasmius tenuissimus TaxID=585030 RepID=A0ABR3A7X5_9AGAR
MEEDVGYYNYVLLGDESTYAYRMSHDLLFAFAILKLSFISNVHHDDTSLPGIKTTNCSNRLSNPFSVVQPALRSMTDPLPYNLTIPSQTGSLIYYPSRTTDRTASDGWELAYPSVVDTKLPERRGRGADFHRSTKAGASITFNWLGTAIYVYGNATKDSYKFSVDGQDVHETFDVPEGGLLGSKTGMPYKEHTAMLKVVGGEGLAFQYADLTIGLGYPGCARSSAEALTKT